MLLDFRPTLLVAGSNGVSASRADYQSTKIGSHELG